MKQSRGDARLGRGLYGIADTGLIAASGMSLEEGVLLLIEAGAGVVQLRAKGLSGALMLESALRLAALCAERGVISIVNDRVDVALASGAGGVHLGQDDLPIVAARSMLSDGAIIGYSTHDLAQVRSAMDEGADYIGFGPVFPTSTKANPDPTVGVEGLARAVELVGGRVPVVAIGGIGLSEVPLVAETGADLTAVISDIFARPDPVGRARSVHEAMSAGGGVK